MCNKAIVQNALYVNKVSVNFQRMRYSYIIQSSDLFYVNVLVTFINAWERDFEMHQSSLNLEDEEKED